jgi:amino acid transporter
MSKTDKKIDVGPKKSLLDQPNMVHAMSYFPYFIGAVGMYLLWNTDKKQALHHIKYSAIIAAIAVLLMIIADDFWDYIFNVAYVIASGFFALKAYKWEKVEVEIFDVLEDKIAEKIKK